MGFLGPDTWTEKDRKITRQAKREERQSRADRRKQWRQHPARTAWRSRPGK